MSRDDVSTPLRHGRGEAGFTLIEILVCLVICMVGLAGVLGMEGASARAIAYSRHATEASILNEDKIEALRMIPFATLPVGTFTEQVDAQGLVGAGFFTRTWTTTKNGLLADIAVTVSWLEQGSEAHAITYRTQRR